MPAALAAPDPAPSVQRRNCLSSRRQISTLYQGQRPGGDTCYRIGLDRPGFHAVPHVPEHPLVSTSGAEVTANQRPFALRKGCSHRVGFGDHVPYDLAELLAAIGADPPLIPRIGRAPADEFLAHFPINPVTRQDRADPFGIRPAANSRE